MFIVFCLSDGNNVELFIVAFATHRSSTECQQMSLDPSREISSATYGKPFLFFFGDELKTIVYICSTAHNWECSFHGQESAVLWQDEINAQLWLSLDVTDLEMIRDNMCY